MTNALALAAAVSAGIIIGWLLCFYIQGKKTPREGTPAAKRSYGKYARHEAVRKAIESSSHARQPVFSPVDSREFEDLMSELNVPTTISLTVDKTHKKLRCSYLSLLLKFLSEEHTTYSRIDLITFLKQYLSYNYRDRSDVTGFEPDLKRVLLQHAMITPSREGDHKFTTKMYRFTEWLQQQDIESSLELNEVFVYRKNL